jgi:hypothetical protein
MKNSLTISSFLLLLLTNVTFAQELIGQQCIQTPFSGILCPPPGGVIYSTPFSGYVCGKGQCVVTQFQGIICSRVSGGQVVQTQFQGIQCVGGCEQASYSNCNRPSF